VKELRESELNLTSRKMTTFYPNQSAPSFLKKYARNAYNRAQHDAHPHQNIDESAIDLQPYRSTPLILPGAKCNLQRNLPTDSYLRHHPNPQMRGPPTHDFADIQMKQKVADSVLQRYGGDQSQNGPNLVHKQFNSPIGLYSDNLIESTIKSTVSPSQSVASANSSSVPSPNGTLSRQHSQQNRPTKIQGYKKTVVYDPLKSETYRALQENSFAGERARVEPDSAESFPTKSYDSSKETSLVFPTTRPNLTTSCQLDGRPERRHPPKRIVQAINVPRFGRN